MLEDEANQREKLEGEIAILQSQLMQISFEADEVSCFQIFKYYNFCVLIGSAFLKFSCMLFH